MSFESARIFLIVAFCVGLCIWIFGQGLLRKRLAPFGERSTDGPSPPRPPDPLQYACALDMPRDAVIPRLAGLLAAAVPARQAGMARILETTDQSLVFEHRMLGITKGQFQVLPSSGPKVQVQLTLKFGKVHILRATGFAISYLSLATLVWGFLWLQRTALQSEDPAIRNQCVQIVQAIHLLWPPFLFAGIYRARIRFAAEAMRNLLHNLPHLPSSKGCP